MRNFFIHAVVFVFSGMVFLQPALAEPIQYSLDEDQSSIEFSFRSTLHSVNGVAHHFKGTFQGAAFLQSGNVDVEVKSLDTDNPKRDEQMGLMFDFMNYPTIRYSFSDIVFEKNFGNQQNQIILRGLLTIKDQPLPVEIPSFIEKTEDGYILSGSVDLSLKAFGLKPPSVLMMIRVFDTVNVKFKVLLKENPS